jgi:C4-dicarboxylate-specific signal transduction histidine kinase
MMAAAWMILGAICGAAGVAAILHLRTPPSAARLQRTAYELTENITDRKLAEQELVTHQAHLRATLEAKLKASLAASAIAHEINQPLSTILLQSKLALRQGDAVAALATVAREADRVVKTIDKMKVLLRSLQTEHEPVELAEAATRSAIFMQGMLDKHVVALRFTGADLGAWVLGDAVQIQFAINNLLRNAIEAIEANAPRREVLLALRADDAFVELAVGDTGPGWSGAERTDQPLMTTKDEGTGIGLYVIRMVVKNHGGTIDFGRSPLGGAEVRLRFPRHHGE